jgi:hypothetical protein
MPAMAKSAKLHRIIPFVLVSVAGVVGCDQPKEGGAAAPTAAAPAPTAAAPAPPAAAPAPAAAAPAPAAAAPAGAPAAPAAAAAAPAAAAPAAAAPAAAAAAPPAHPASCEVEVFGEFKTTAQLPAKHSWFTYVSDGDCLAKGANILGRSVITAPPKFGTEVFAPWGSNLTVCIVAEEAPGKPAVLYGKAKAPLHAEGTGEVTFHNIAVDVQKGPTHTFPKPSGPRPAPAAAPAGK